MAALIESVAEARDERRHGTEEVFWGRCALASHEIIANIKIMLARMKQKYLIVALGVIGLSTFAALFSNYREGWESNLTEEFAAPSKTPLAVMSDEEWGEVQGDNIIFRYPPALVASGVQVQDPIVEERGQGVRFVGIPLAIPGRQEPAVSFGLLVHPNSDRMSLNEWFISVIDPDGVLLESQAFVPKNFPDGREALILSSPLPDSYDGPPVSYAYMRSPQGSRIVSIALSQDHGLELLGFATYVDRDKLMHSLVERITLID